ncbi:MAG: ABC transporter substrate-binding protein [Sulfuricella denitrificans]|nr:ABC transporter substrate-binding protein [Sulfuricella denitrificans]
MRNTPESQRWHTRLLHWVGFIALCIASGLTNAGVKPPVLIGIDAEFGVPGSTSAQAVRLGISIAIDEINHQGGVLDGRKLVLIERDNRSVPARSLQNLRDFAAMPDLVAVFCGKYSPVVVESLPAIHELKIILLDPWAAADSITEHNYQPSYTFRLSLRDSWAMDTMLAQARSSGFKQVGLLLPNTEWGRSNLRAAENNSAHKNGINLAGKYWYNWGDNSLLAPYQKLRKAGAQVLVLVANEREGAILIREMVALPQEERMPILSHWGLTGGKFYDDSKNALRQLDFSVVQTYSFLAGGAKAQFVLDAAKKLDGVQNARQLQSPVGVAHAYDLMHILARAIDLAQSTDRASVRNALERIRNYDGLIKHYSQPFTPTRHDALGPEQAFMARYAADGAIEPLAPARKER